MKRLTATNVVAPGLLNKNEQSERKERQTDKKQLTSEAPLHRGW